MLEWGETPWDGLSRETLLREVQRMYCALSASESALNICKMSEPGHPYWTREGTGGRALSKINEITRPIRKRYGWDDSKAGSLFRTFTRYANDLLFFHKSDSWVICIKCKCWLGRMPRGNEGPIRECSFCHKPTRPITWDDLRPVRQ